MGVDAARFRSVLGQWPSGVTVVTTVVDGAWHGMTASSFSSVSLDPPLVSVCLSRSVWTHGLIESSGVFAVNILAKDQAPVGMIFAGQRPEIEDRFDGLAARPAITGAPVLTEALGWLDCRVIHAYDGGDHTIFVGEVLQADTPRVTAPLLFHSRAWGQFADLLPDEAHAEDTGLVATLRASGATAPDVATVVGAVRDAGVRVRVADLTQGPVSDRDLLAAGAPRVDSATASVRVSAPEQVPLAAGLGAGHLDIQVTSLSAADTVQRVVEAARSAGLGIGITLVDAFSSAADEAHEDRVLAQLDRLCSLGPDQVTLDDADAAATPLSVRRLLQEAVTRSRPVPLALVLADPAGLGLANALTAMKSGVRLFEATLGGVDGRVALEDLLHLVDSLEIVSPTDRPALHDAARTLESLWGRPLPGRTYRQPQLPSTTQATGDAPPRVVPVPSTVGGTP